DDQVRDEVMTFLTAGHETVATALSWTWYCLSRNEPVRARLEDELKTVLGDRVPTAEDVPRLQFTEMVFAEAMRLYPPVWGMTRHTVDDYRAGDYLIPGGSVVGMTQYVMHRDSRYYRDPNEFDPARWTAREKAGRPKYSYFPFGGGPRLCIGEPFAWLEGILVIATIAQRWRMNVVHEHPIEFQPLLTLRPKHGIRVLLDQRSTSGATTGTLASAVGL
ncbi:MAG: cytochrome P450, partial [Planctomycetaceae bacterium]